MKNLEIKKFTRLFAAIAIVLMVLPIQPVPVSADGVFIISGMISPANAIASIKFNDGAVDYLGTLASDGMSYTIENMPDGSVGTVTAEAAAGFIISPESGYTGLTITADLADLNFDGTAITYTISGNVGVPGVKMDFTGGTPVLADETGNYTFTVPYNWTGTIIPSLAGYTFDPASQDFTNLTSDQSFDFSASASNFTISGNVGAAGVTVDFTGGSPVISDEAGAYSITVPYNWSGTVMPILPGFTFIPASQNFANVQSNQVVDFVPASHTDTPMPTATETPMPTATETPMPTFTETMVFTNTNTSIPLPTATSTSSIPAVGPGTYDDTSASVKYAGKWKYVRTVGPFNKTDHYTNATGTGASLVFNGTKIVYVFPTYKTRGHVRIDIDGAHIADLDLYSLTMIWQAKWTSPDLAPGVHTITITRIDGYIDVDAFIVSNEESGSPTPTATMLPTDAPTQTPVPSLTPTQTMAVSQTPTSTAILTNTPTPIPSYTPTPAPTTIGRTIFGADFETGDFSYFDGSAGEIFGKGTFYEHKIVNSPAFGNYSAALSIGSGDSTAAYLFTYAVPSTPLGVYSADIYIPSTVQPADWWAIWQWKSVDNTYNMPIIHLNVLKSGGGLVATMFYTPGGSSANTTQKIVQTNPIAFPTDRWVNITGYYMSMSDNSGSVVFLQDGVKIYEKTGFMTKPGNKDVLWSVHSYADEITPNPATIYFDNIRISEGG